MAKKKEETKPDLQDETEENENLWDNPLVDCNDVGLILLKKAIYNLFDRSDNNFRASEAADELLMIYPSEETGEGPECDTYWGAPFDFSYNCIDRFVVEIHDNLPAQMTAYLVTLLSSVDQARQAKQERDYAEHSGERWEQREKIKALEEKINVLELSTGKKKIVPTAKKKKGGK